MTKSDSSLLDGIYIKIITVSLFLAGLPECNCRVPALATHDYHGLNRENTSVTIGTKKKDIKILQVKT